jgi:hypothetical protein
LYISLTKVKLGEKKKEEVLENLNRIGKIYQNLYIVFNSAIPEQKLRKQNVEILKLVIVIINKILGLMAVVAETVEVSTEYAIRELFTRIFNEEQYYSIVSDKQSYRFFLMRNSIPIPTTYSKPNEEIMKFITKYI